MNDLVLYWFLFVAVSAMIGSFLGTLLAWAVRGIVRRIIKWSRKGEEA